MVKGRSRRRVAGQDDRLSSLVAKEAGDGDGAPPHLLQGLAAVRAECVVGEVDDGTAGQQRAHLA